MVQTNSQSVGSRSFVTFFLLILRKSIKIAHETVKRILIGSQPKNWSSPKHASWLAMLRGLLALESCVDANYQLSKGKSAETSGGLLVALPSLPSAQDKLNRWMVVEIGWNRDDDMGHHNTVAISKIMRNQSLTLWCLMPAKDTTSHALTIYRMNYLQLEILNYKVFRWVLSIVVIFCGFRELHKLFFMYQFGQNLCHWVSGLYGGLAISRVWWTWSWGMDRWWGVPMALLFFCRW